MADKTKIEWTEATWNPITGCSVVSPGCTNCYAMRLAGTRMKHHWSREGLTQESKAGPVWTGDVRFNEQWLDKPLRWKRPRMIFVCAHGDLFHEDVPDQWIDKVFAVMALAPRHVFQVLTKRSARMREYFAGIQDGDGFRSRSPYIFDAVDDLCNQYRLGDRPAIIGWPLPNVWLGASTEDQERFYERAPDIDALSRQGWKTWLSYEPALGPLDVSDLLAEDGTPERAAHGPWVDWIVAGGESGPGSRPADPDWFRDLRDQCAAAGVPFFFKQWGDWIPTTDPRTLGLPDGSLAAVNCEQRDIGADVPVWRVGKKAAGALLDGREHREWPR